MLQWEPKISLKDVIQVGVLVVGLTLVLGRQEAATKTNTQTLKALQQIQAVQGEDITRLRMELADQAGYDRAKREIEQGG